MTMVPPSHVSSSESASNPFLDPIIARAQMQPDGVFGNFFHDGEWSSVTNSAFLARALSFAHMLRSLDVEAGALVFLILDHGLDAPAGFVGTMLASAVPSFLPYPNAKQDERSYWQQHVGIFEAAAPAAIICYPGLEAELRERTAHLDIPIIGVSALANEDIDDCFDLPPAAASALVQHSSGTTGLKKGIALSYAAIASQLHSYSQALGLAEVERPIFASWLPLYHDMGLIAAFLLPLWAGIPIVSIDPFEWVARPETLLDAIERFRATHAWLPNFAFVHIARRAPGKRQWDLASLQALISCSEPCKPEAFDLFSTRFAQSFVKPETLQTCYAMAETVFAVSQSVPNAPVARITIDRQALESDGTVRVLSSDDASSPSIRSLTLLSNGPCIPGCEVATLGPDGALPGGKVGEIAVRADYLFSGYRGNPDATANAMFNGWYRTGDTGFVHDGEVYVVGRIKEILIINGKNIYANDVENSITGLPGVKPGRAVVFGHYSARYGSEQMIIVAETDGSDIDPDELASRLNRAVFAEVGISCADIRIVPQGWLVKTTSGKISRASNALKYAEMLKSI